MNFRKYLSAVLFLSVFCLIPVQLKAYEIFIYRPYNVKNAFSLTKKITVHGEFFGQLQYPSNFPSYNDLSGPDDRWTFGFQNRLYLTPSTTVLAQLVTHDDGNRRTKFDWHFSLRQKIFDNLVIIIGHDSNHDSDFQSTLNGKAFFVNRNYVGFGIPFTINGIYIEPFTWFFHHSNQPGHLDLSGDTIVQEYGLRIGTWIDNRIGIHFQAFSQMESLFSLGQAFMADLIIRIRFADFFEMTAGSRLWTDLKESRLGSRQKFFKLFWGIAIPF